MVGKKLGRLLMIPMALVLAVTLAATACTPAQAELLQGVLQNVNSANGTITLVTADGKTVTVNIDTKTLAEAGGANVTVNALKPGDKVEITVEGKDKGRTARKIKAQESKGNGNENENENEHQGQPTAAIGSGIVELRVTDPPPANVKSAVIHFTQVQVHKASQNQGDNETENENESGNMTGTSGNTTGTSGNATVGSNEGSSWITIATNVTSFDLMDVVGVEKVLGSANLSAGKYTQIRMTVTNVTGVTTDNASFSAEISGGDLKVVGNFTVGNGTTTVLTLDFDGEKSLVRTGEGKFIFKPVVKLLVDGKAAATDQGGSDGQSGKSGESGKSGDSGKPTDNATTANQEGKGKGD